MKKAMSPFITADGPPPEPGPFCSVGIGVEVTIRVGKLAGVGDGLGLGEGDDGQTPIKLIGNWALSTLGRRPRFEG